MSTQRTLIRPQNLFIQMSGAPGSGKSTVAGLVASRINAVIIDHDVIRSSLIESGMEFNEAAKYAYPLQWAQARHFMKQGFSVIVDSACNYDEVLKQGAACASELSYTYWYIECKVDDIELLQKRLCNRESMGSQRTGVDRPPAAAGTSRCPEDSLAQFKTWMEAPCRPEGNVIVVDSTLTPGACQASILERVLG